MCSFTRFSHWALLLHELRVVPFGYALEFKDNCSFLMFLFNVFARRCICIVFLDFICTVVYLHCLFYVFADRPVVGLGRRLWIPVRDPGIGTPHCSTHICQIYFLFQIRKIQNTKIPNNNIWALHCSTDICQIYFLLIVSKIQKFNLISNLKSAKHKNTK